MVWDRQSSRLSFIRGVIDSCGIRSRWVEEFLAPEQTVRSRLFCIAVVALDARAASDDLGLQVIRNLNERGFSVLGYADGVRFWSIGARCRALLAGATQVLDSGEANFAPALRSFLMQRVRAEADKESEEETIKNKMRKVGIVGESQALMSVFRQLLRVSALSDLPTLITGETGTGKELLARAIHRLDPKRRHGPFVALNCGAISLGLAESELFGHRRGAFTGSEGGRKGLIRAAEGGVLFLDEIGELDDALQVKLLRVLQEHSVLGVGEDQEIAVSVRVIAATNRNLDKMIREKKFRADLFHRLNVLALHIPPLRERPDDLQPLIEHLLEKNQHFYPVEPVSMDPDFLEALKQIDLPGNARQLENLLRRAMLKKEAAAPLTLQDLPAEVWRQLAERGEPPMLEAEHRNARDRSAPATPTQILSSCLVNLLDTHGWNLAQTLQFCERALLEATLRRNRGNQSRAARLLGLTPRSVYSKIRRHNLRENA